MARTNLTGKTINDFVILERIGRGGMGDVYRANQISMQREVALKVIQLDEELEHDEHFQKRFAREINLIIALEHMYILPVYAHGVENNYAFLAMRLLTGGTLEDLIKNQSLPLEQALQIFKQFTKGLAYAHSQGIVHRDLKPSNIIFDADQNAYLTDFGLAKMVNGDNTITKSTNIVGTPLYMSPEQLHGQKLDHRSDIYSLGIILYRMLTGKFPYPNHDRLELPAVIYNHIERQPTPMSEYNPLIPERLQDIVSKALEKTPDQRFQNIGEMMRALHSVVGDVMDSSTEYPLPASDLRIDETKTPTSRRFRQIMFGILSTIALSLVIGMILFLIIADSMPEHGQILTGEFGTSNQINPTEQEIYYARQKLGDSSFIAIVPCNQTSEYHTGVTREMVELARDYSIPVRVYDPDSDVYQQVTLFERARIENAAAFIICTLESNTTNTALASLAEANYPIVTDEIETTYKSVSVYTGNYNMGLAAGLTAGVYIRDNLGGRANIVVMTLEGNDNIENRAQGLIDGALSMAPDAQIVATVRGATQDWGKESITQVIEDGIEFDMILSINDAGSFGAIEALEDANYSPADVSIFSVDAENIAQQYIAEDYFFRGSLALGRAEFAHAAINIIVKILGGSDVPEFVEIPPGQVITRAYLDGLSGE